MIDIFRKYSQRGLSSPKWAALAIALVLTALITAKPADLAGADLQEYQVKAALINNFARFIQWPVGSLSDPDVPFTIYILGEDRFGSAFDTFEGKMVHNRPLTVARIEAWKDIPDDCRILFIGVGEKAEIQRVLEKIGDRAILTISDKPLFSEFGGIIGLVTLNNKIRFNINLVSAREAGLTVSSNLLKLALSIHGEAR